MISEASPIRRYVTAADLSVALGVPEQTLQDWRSDGVGPPWVRLTARSVRYCVEDVERWLAERTVQPAAPVTASA